jgi:4-methyl-5(b-hydroxyethyl)-thiazole monophosphate biosynthesis
MTVAKRVLLLLADGFELLEAAGFTDVLGWADVTGDEPITLVSAGLRSPLKTTFGFAAVPDTVVSEVDLESFDALAIPGGFGRAGFYKDALADAFTTVIRQFDGAKKPVGSVCVAGLALGAAGVLRGRRATTYHKAGGKLKDQLEGYGARFVDQPVVVDGRLITSTGPGTAIEVAFALLAALTSQANADHVRALMRVPTPSDAWRATPQVPTRDAAA